MPILELKADESAIRRILRAISDTLFRHARSPADQPHHGLDKLGQRLSEAVARLERLDAERERRADARFGKITENRIVWSELIELEMQEIDEQISRIRSSAGRATQSNLRGGGAHEHDDS
jgi:hypothetical protein